MTNLDDVSKLVTVPAEERFAALEAFLAREGYTTGFYPPGGYKRLTVGEAVGHGLPNLFWMRYGEIRESVVSLEWVWKGKTLVSRNVPRSATGPDLKGLWIGSRGAMGRLRTVTWRIWRCDRPYGVVAGFVPDVLSARRLGLAVWAEDLRPVVFGAWPEQSRRAWPSPPHTSAAEVRKRRTFPLGLLGEGHDGIIFMAVYSSEALLIRALTSRTEDLSHYYGGRVVVRQQGDQARRCLHRFMEEPRWFEEMAVHPLNLLGLPRPSPDPAHQRRLERQLSAALQ